MFPLGVWEANRHTFISGLQINNKPIKITKEGLTQFGVVGYSEETDMLYIYKHMLMRTVLTGVVRAIVYIFNKMKMSTVSRRERIKFTFGKKKMVPQRNVC